MSVLGVFIDCHDELRIFHKLLHLKNDKEDMPLVLNTLSYIFMSYGIPMFYYGTEAKFSGG